jgi:redox-sensitive bicupin YhaK (pirin superfamily)
MSLTLRPSDQRGHANHGWLDSFHSFSFARYYDPAHMGFRDLRVINDDVIQPGAGFPTHDHNNMEIVSYVVRGALAHKDSTGSAGVIRRGDIQAMSAGNGIHHSEYNPSQTEDMRLLQIWIMPNQNGLKAHYDQKHFSDDEKKNTLRLIVSPIDANGDGKDGALPIHQDVSIYASLLDGGKSLSHQLAPGRALWLQLIDGMLDVNGQAMKSGDGLAIEDADTVTITAHAASEFRLFDLG